MSRVPEAADEPFLLAEAIRFYNYGIHKGKQRLYDNRFIEKVEFDPITEETIKEAVAELGVLFGNRICALFKALENNAEFKKHLREERQTKYVQSLLRDWYGGGMLRVRAVLSEQWRQKGSTILALDGIAAVSQRIRLLLQASTAAEYRKGTYPNAQITYPWPGGNRAFSPSFQALPQNIRDTELGRTRLSSWREIFYETQPEETGLTEKLYAQIATELYAQSHPRARAAGPRQQIVDGSEIDPYWKIALGLEATLDQQLQTLEGTGKQRASLLINKWLFNLRGVEAVFDDAIRRTSPTAGASPPWTIWFGADGSKRVGLPWALQLSSYLRLYLLRLKVAVLLASMPYTRIYRDINGYVAVALWEGIRGGTAPHYLFDGCLHRNWPVPYETDSGRRGALEADNEDLYLPDANGLDFALDDLWKKLPAGEGRLVHYSSHNALLDLAIVNHGYDPQLFIDDLAPILSNGETIREFPFVVTRNPVMLEALLDPKEVGLSKVAVLTKEAETAKSTGEHYLKAHSPERKERRSYFHTDAVFGAELVAQGFLYVAAQLLKSALAEIFAEGTARYANNYAVVAGSFLWGGKFSPHETHRDGYCYDLDYIGVPGEVNDLNCWPGQLRYQEVIERYRQQSSDRTRVPPVAPWNPQACKQFVPTTPSRLSATVLRATQPLEPTNRVPKSRAHVCREFVRDLLNAEFKQVYARNGTQATVAEAASEMDEFEKLEVRLSGMPLHANDEQNRLFHLAYMAILLSMPIEIIWGSPLVHLRCMRAVRATFAADADAIFNPGVAGATPDDEVETIPLDLPRFAFLPHNHHNHWHVSYWFGDAKLMKQWRTVFRYVDERVTTPLLRFKQCFPLWRRLGVDMAGLNGYFKSYRAAFDNAPGSQLAEVAKGDLRELVAALEEYGVPADTPDHSIWRAIDALVRPARAFDVWPPAGSMLFDSGRCSKNLILHAMSALQAGTIYEFENEVEYLDTYGLGELEEYTPLRSP